MAVAALAGAAGWYRQDARKTNGATSKRPLRPDRLSGFDLLLAGRRVDIDQADVEAARFDPGGGPIEILIRPSDWRDASIQPVLHA